MPWKTVPVRSNTNNGARPQNTKKEGKSALTLSQDVAVHAELSESQLNAAFNKVKKMRNALGSHAWAVKACKAVVDHVDEAVKHNVDTMMLSAQSEEKMFTVQVEQLGLGIGSVALPGEAGVTSLLQSALLLLIDEALKAWFETLTATALSEDLRSRLDTTNSSVSTNVFDPVADPINSADAKVLSRFGVSMEPLNKLGAYHVDDGAAPSSSSTIKVLVPFMIHCPRTLYHNLLVANLLPKSSDDGETVGWLSHPLHRLVLIGNSFDRYDLSSKAGCVCSILSGLLECSPVEVHKCSSGVASASSSEVKGAFSDTVVATLKRSMKKGGPTMAAAEEVLPLLVETIGAAPGTKKWPKHLESGPDLL